MQSAMEDKQNKDEGSHNSSQQPVNNEHELASSTTSWWGWIESAKNKSAEAYEFIKRDLNELKETVHHDTAKAMSSTASYVKETITGIGNTVAPDPLEEEAIKIEDKKDQEGSENKNNQETDEALVMFNKAKDKLNSWLETIADAFTINRQYDDDDELLMVNGNQIISVERWKEILRSIQIDAQTYCHEPDGPPENYESWLATFNLIDYQTQMAFLLETVPEMKEFYSQLVPNSLSDAEFWHRYYYKVHQAIEIEKKKVLNLNKPDEMTSNGQSSVEIKMLEQSFCNPNLRSNEKENEQEKMNENEEKVTSIHSSETKHSDGSDDWEKTEFNDEKSESNEEIKSDDEWVKYE